MIDAADEQDCVTEPVRAAVASKVLRSIGIFLAIYLLLPVPIELLFRHAGLSWGGFAGQSVFVIYAPLAWLYEHVDAVKSFYDWYEHLLNLR